MSGTTIRTSDTKLEAIKFQSSSYGVVIPVVYGVTRVPGNLLWYDGFKAVPHTSIQGAGGKGGGVQTANTTYSYTAAAIIGICEGQVSGINAVWRGKKRYLGGPTAVEVLSAPEVYVVPGGGGSYTVTNSARFSSPVSVLFSSGGGESGSDAYLGAEGGDYTRVDGVYTFGAALAGLTMTITYQYLQVGVTQTSLQQLGLSFADGPLGQPVWSFLTSTYPTKALGYSGISYVYSSAYDLGSDAAMQNHSFEIIGKMAWTISAGVPDANPALITYDMLTNGQFGAGFPAARLGSTGDWETYCRAAGLLLSPAFTMQISAIELVKRMCRLTNTAPVWSEGVLKFIPYGDTTLTGNAVTYTPNVTAIYDLNDQAFLDLDVPVKLTRKAPADAYNHIQLEYWYQNNEYNVDIADAKDQANIDVYGLRPAEMVEAHWCVNYVAARAIAQLLLQRSLYIRNTYSFRLPIQYSLLEPMDIVTLTDAALLLDKVPVRITTVEEGNNELMLTAEDFPLGVATNTLYPSQSGVGFAHNYNVAPGSVTAPTIFEAPGALTETGLELYVAAVGLNANWGGANVWVSLDGSNFKQVGVINGASRMGTLSGAPGASGAVAVTLLAGQLISGSAADMNAANTLCYIGGTAPEYFSYQTAALVSALTYLLDPAKRGLYKVPGVTHASGEKFVRVDQAIARSGPLDPDLYVGKTVHVKLTSFNVYGGGEELLSAVTDYTYTVTGRFMSSWDPGSITLVEAYGPGAQYAVRSNIVTRVASSGAFNDSVSSVETYQSGAACSFKMGVGIYGIAGLGLGPTSTSSFNWGVILRGDGAAQARYDIAGVSQEVNLIPVGTHTGNELFTVQYDNNRVTWLVDGVVKLALDSPVIRGGMNLRFVVSLVSSGIQVNSIRFYPTAGTQTVSSLNRDPDCSDPTAWSYLGVVTETTGGVTGRFCLSSPDAGISNHVHNTTRSPIDRTKAYRVRCLVRKVGTFTVTPTFYLGFMGFDASGNVRYDLAPPYTLLSLAPASINTYFSDVEVVLSNAAVKALNAGLAFISPHVILGYTGAGGSMLPGIIQVQDVRMEEIASTATIEPGAVDQLAEITVASISITGQSGAPGTWTLIGTLVFTAADTGDAEVSVSGQATHSGTPTIFPDRAFCSLSLHADFDNSGAPHTLTSERMFDVSDVVPAPGGVSITAVQNIQGTKRISVSKGTVYSWPLYGQKIEPISLTVTNLVFRIVNIMR